MRGPRREFISRGYNLLLRPQRRYGLGGFNGTDPAPSLAAFERLVGAHKIHFFVGANSDSFGGGSGGGAAQSAAPIVPTWGRYSSPR